MSPRTYSSEDLVGRRFGTRTAAAQGPDFPSKGRRWFVKCDCGKESLVGTTNLKRSERCVGCSKRYEDLTGKVFDKRTVLSLAGKSNDLHIRWNVRCACGNEFTCLLQDLKRGGWCGKCTPKRKGPRLSRRKRPYEWRYNAAVNRARHPFLISYDEFFEFTKTEECHYCGARIEWGEPFGKVRPSGLNLDRKDSFLPYTKENIVVACRRCNYGKNNFFSYEEWKEIGAVIRTWGVRDVPRLESSGLEEKTIGERGRNQMTDAQLINQLAANVHKANAKWWVDLETGEPLKRNVGELLCLVHSEISEAMEGHRKNLMDDKLPHRPMVEVELADAVIRIFDIAAGFGLDLGGAYSEKMEYNSVREDHSREHRLGVNGKKY